MTKIKFWGIACFFWLANGAAADDLCRRFMVPGQDGVAAPLEYTLGLVRSEAIPYLDRIENTIQRAGLKIELSAPWQPRSSEEKLFALQAFYQPLFDHASYPLILGHMLKGEVQVLVLSGPQAVQRFKTLVGHKDPYLAEKETLRHAYGLDMVANGLHSSEDIYAAAREVPFFLNKIPFHDTTGLMDRVDDFVRQVGAEEFTLGLIKPEAVAAGNAGRIMELIEASGLKIVGAKKLQLKKSEAESFYQEHFGKPFFNDLVAYMTSGPIYVLFIKGPYAVKKYRDVLGKTDPAQAAPGTIRKLFGKSKSFNAGHGSDALNSALRELNFFVPFFTTPEELGAVEQFRTYADHMAQDEYTLALITPDALIGTSLASIVHMIEENGITVAAQQKLQLKPWMLEKIYQADQTTPSFAGFVDYMAPKEVFAMVLRAPKVVARFNKLLGNANSVWVAPGTIRRLMRSEVKYPQALYGSPTVLQGQKDVDFILGQMDPEINVLVRRDFAAYQERHGIQVKEQD
ncbi:MAG: hypothetical protein J6Y94_04425 [Bacteriovoracaceae bacterium]|nr:hypothetical protein [Bacteriovoracaceae bacterium]